MKLGRFFTKFRNKKVLVVASLFLFSVTLQAGRQFYHLLAQRSQPVLTIAPSPQDVDYASSYKFTGAGGVPAYSYSLVGSSGSVNPANGVYTAANTGTISESVRVLDSVGQIADATVNVAAPLITCGSGPRTATSSYTGHLYDSGGPAANYLDNAYCEFIINVGRGNSLTVHFNTFDIENSYDFLEFYDSSGVRQGNYTGTVVPADLTTTDGYFKIIFHSDSSVTQTGFDISWTASVPSNTLSISSMPPSIGFGFPDTSTLAAIGGVRPYTFSIVSGDGSTSAATNLTAIYNYLGTSTATVARVTDAIGQTADVTIPTTQAAMSITSVSPNSGNKAGGNLVYIYGTGFLPGPTITIGGAACTSVTVYSSTQLRCTAPSSASGGKRDIVITNTNATTITGVQAYEYASGIWTSMPVPSAATRSGHAHVWTGDRLIVWSGQDPTCAVATCIKSDGFVYNQLTDSWTAMAAAPIAGRVESVNEWTGHELIIYAGRIGGGIPNDGAKYNPYTDTWSSIAVSGWGPGQDSASVWTGKEVIMHGGQNGYVRADGAAYNPRTDTWRTISSGPAIWLHNAVWTGKKMIVNSGWNNPNYYNTTYMYDPETNTWTTSAASVLYGKSLQQVASGSSRYLAWSGSKMIVYGADRDFTAGATNSAGIYNPETDTWSYPPTLNNYNSSVANIVWTGNLAIISRGTSISAGGYYEINSLDPETQTVRPIELPTGFAESSPLVWTGHDVIACFGYASVNTGATCRRLDLETQNNRLSSMTYNSWLTTQTTAAPAARTNHTSLWTGQNMIVWGGEDGTQKFNSGYKYNPFDDSWTAISTTGAPTARSHHKALWIGNRMVIWGGQTAGGVQTNTGAIYNPFNDSWTAMSTTGAPSARESYSAISTGSKFIVWGGLASGSYLNDGAIYDVNTNTWTALPSTNAPSARSRHKAQWNGTKMFIWGGADAATYANTGAIYDLAGNTWTAMSTTSAPSARADFSMIRYGDKLVVWGGVDSSGTALATGAVYDIVGDSWTATSTTGAPSARSQASTIYTGRYMIISSGVNGGTSLSDSFEYNPLTDTWTALSASGLSARYSASAVWTGTVGDGRAQGAISYRNNTTGDTGRLIIWGGFDGTSYKADGKVFNLPNQQYFNYFQSYHF